MYFQNKYNLQHFAEKSRQAKSNANTANCLNQGKEYTVYTLYKEKYGHLCFIWVPMEISEHSFCWCDNAQSNFIIKLYFP